MQRNLYFFKKLTNVSLILGEDSFYLKLIWPQTLPKTPLICHEIAPRCSRDRFRWPQIFSFGSSTTSRTSFEPLPDRPTSYLVDFGRALCLFGGHLASPSTSEQLQIYECIIETCIFEINSFIVKLGAYIASRRRNYWPHLPSVMSLVANDIWGAAVLRRMASSIHTHTHT